MKTILHAYRFDISDEEGKAAWRAFQNERASGPRCHGPILSNVYYAFKDLDGWEIELETKHLFDNQWNTAPIDGVSEKGLRVFDYALQSHGLGHVSHDTSSPHYIRQGHWLEQTEEMAAIRRDTAKCGYCGRQEPTGRFDFCPHCLDSEYLKSSELHLTRMLPVAAGFSATRPPLTEEESARLIPLYRAAQMNGTTERGKARIAAERAKVAKDYDKAIHAATTKRDGWLWLMDRGFPVNNVIYYDHTGRFSFGWRGAGIDDAVLADLLDIISEFPFPYEIKCADGRKLEGNIG